MRFLLLIIVFYSGLMSFAFAQDGDLNKTIEEPVVVGKKNQLTTVEKPGAIKTGESGLNEWLGGPDAVLDGLDCDPMSLPYFVKTLDKIQRKLLDDVSIGHALYIKQSDIKNTTSLLGQGYDYTYTQQLVRIPGLFSDAYLLYADIYFNDVPSRSWFFPADTLTSVQKNAIRITNDYFDLTVASNSLNTAPECKVRTRVLHEPTVFWGMPSEQPNHTYIVEVTVDRFALSDDISTVRRDAAEKSIANAVREIGID